ncbi:MAG TPA: hypothetical protein GXZ29_12580 [Clostridiales bacterium]|nr:hypothetical protein [Clostridiales bacterium]
MPYWEDPGERRGLTAAQYFVWLSGSCTSSDGQSAMRRYQRRFAISSQS